MPTKYRLINIDDLQTAQINLANDTWASGRGVLKSTTLSIKTTEAIDAGDFINIFDHNGEASIRRAVASDPLMFTNGFVLESYAQNTSAKVHLIGFNSAVTILSTQSLVYLDDGTPGNFTTARPTTPGYIVQSLGVAIPNFGIFFFPQKHEVI